MFPPRHNAEAGSWTDADGLTVEDFGLAENLMAACALGAPPVIAAAGDAGALEALQVCLERLLRP